MFYEFKAREYLKTKALAQDLEKVAANHGYKNLEDLLYDCYRAQEKAWDCEDAQDFLDNELEYLNEDGERVLDFTREDIEIFADAYRNDYDCDYSYWENLQSTFDDLNCDYKFSWQQTEEENE